jgi:hypothetical protein
MPKRFLIHDEVETFYGSRGQGISVRIRIWMGVNATPIVLIGQVNGQPHPRQIATRVANYIQESLLYYPENGFLYYEAGLGLSAGLSQQVFEYFGHGQRLRLFRPETRHKSPDFLEYVLGEKIEH